jgi:hypothetical protein
MLVVINQKDRLFKRGNSHIRVHQLVNGQNNFTNPPIIAGMTNKENHDKGMSCNN